MELAAKYAINSDSLQALINGTLTLIDDFVVVLEEESEALIAVKRDVVDAIQDKKVAMGRAYYEAMMALGEKQDELKASDATTKSRLTEAYKKIQKSFDRNIKALNAAREVASRVQNIIVEAAKKSVEQDSPNYNAGGYSSPSRDTAINFQMSKSV
jgi:hypothetical protein